MEVTKATVYTWIEEILARNQREYNNSLIYVTEITECMRRHYYIRTHPLKPGEKTTLVLMSIGNGLHRLLQEYLASKGWLSEYIASLEFKKFKLVGHVDLYHPEEKIAVELKTVNSIPEKPFQNHVMQLNAYMSMLNIEKGYIVYIAREGKVEVFPHKLDKELWSETQKRAIQFYLALKRGIPPKPEPSHLCNYCVFKWQCYKQRGESNA